jgi:hypothetical protein
VDEDTLPAVRSDPHELAAPRFVRRVDGLESRQIAQVRGDLQIELLSQHGAYREQDGRRPGEKLDTAGKQRCGVAGRLQIAQR